MVKMEQIFKWEQKNYKDPKCFILKDGTKDLIINKKKLNNKIKKVLLKF